MEGFNLVEWVSPVIEWAGEVLYDYQSFAAGLLAILAAWIAARPVWRQLEDTNLQTMIAQREMLVGLKKEAEKRFDRVDHVLLQPLADLSRLTRDPVGDMEEISPHDAFGMQGNLEGLLDWYLVTLKGTETPDIEAVKDELRNTLENLLRALSDVHWIEHNDQHSDDYSIPDEQWEELQQRSREAPARVYELVGRVQHAATKLRAAQDDWLDLMRSLIAKLDRKIVAGTN